MKKFYNPGAWSVEEEILDVISTLSDEATVSFHIFASLVNGGLLIQEKFCTSGSKFFPVREASILEGLSCPGKQTGSLQSYLPLKKWLKNMDVPIHLKYNYSRLSLSRLRLFRITAYLEEKI